MRGMSVLSIPIPDAVKECIIADKTQKAFATYGDRGLNVVPVSTLFVVEDTIWLFDYFFEKTKENIVSSSAVSLVAWSGLVGYQIKANVKYVTSGDDFQKAQQIIAQQHPTRTVKGLVILTPQEIYPVSIDTKV